MRFLIVNDDDNSLYLLEQSLLREFPEAHVTACHGGAQALAAYECLAPERPDAIITDNRMPTMSGVDFARAIRTRDTTTPILMLTGGEETREEALSAGVTAFFSGVSWPELRREVRAVLGKATEESKG